MNLRQRKANNRYTGGVSDSGDEYEVKKVKVGKRKSKQTVKRARAAPKAKEESEDEGPRLVPLGVSVFDLIMPWKNEIVTDMRADIEKLGLAKVVTCKDKQQI